MARFTIGQLAKRVGLRTSALRYYEEQGLIAPHSRTESGYRLYDPETEFSLRFIQRAQRLGFSLGDIRILLKGWREGNLNEESFIKTAESRYIALEKQITQLLALQHELGLFLQDIQKTTASDQNRSLSTVLSQLVDLICLNPLSNSASWLFDSLMERAGCLLNTEKGRNLLDRLKGQHIHIWMEDDGFSILVVSADPEIGSALQEFAELAADCKAHEYSNHGTDFSHNSEGFLLVAKGDHAFIIARLFLEAGASRKIVE
ncbi:MAG: MerR family transcriptional regulator [Anaerolineaceae bacterium]|nr:MerR family transcriptional regulator [Anaerolineaceae bacterium]